MQKEIKKYIDSLSLSELTLMKNDLLKELERLELPSSKNEKKDFFIAYSQELKYIESRISLFQNC